MMISHRKNKSKIYFFYDALFFRETTLNVCRARALPTLLLF